MKRCSLFLVLRIWWNWRKRPHQRLGQLLLNATDHGSLMPDLWTLENDPLAARVREFTTRGDS